MLLEVSGYSLYDIPTHGFEFARDKVRRWCFHMSHDGSTRILIADDFPIIRHGLRQILMRHFNDSVFGEASNCRELVKLVRQAPWDIAILEICMPGKSGFDTLKEVKSIRPEMSLLVLSMYPEDQFAERAIISGADGYLNKAAPLDELIGAIKKVLGGGKYISNTWAEGLVSRLKHGLHKLPHESLSDREYQVMILTASGKTLTEMAEELSLSVKTISTYRTRTLQKMRMRTNAELIRYTLQEVLSR